MVDMEKSEGGGQEAQSGRQLRRPHIVPAQPQWGSGLREAMELDRVEGAGDVAVAEKRSIGQQCRDSRSLSNMWGS